MFAYLTCTDKDQQKRDRLIQALEKYKKDLVYGLPASSCNSRSVSPSQQKVCDIDSTASVTHVVLGHVRAQFPLSWLYSEELGSACNTY